MNLLRIIESTLPVALRDTLDVHAALARVNGWAVETVYVPRRDVKNNPRGVVDIAERHIWPWLATKPARPHVMVIGDVPIPRSGLTLNPDGHSDTTGAYPCPTFWASGGMTGWTDAEENTGFPSKPQFEHVAGDYVFDQNRLPADARCAVGILNLTPAAKNRAWGFTGPNSTWLEQAYARYFDYLFRWGRSDIKPLRPFANGSMFSASGVTTWMLATDSSQPAWKNATQPRPFDGPYGAFYDLKALPNNGDFWYKRTLPVAKFYSYFESYQTDQGVSREQCALMSGSAAVAPVGGEWNMTGWADKTVGELWQQTAVRGKASWIALYGDPTVKIV